MAMQVPNRVREAWGDEVVMAFVPWLDERYITREKAVPRDEYREVLSRLGGLEKEVSLIKEEQARFRVELGQMRSDFKEDQARMRAEFREDVGELRRDVNERFDRMNERFDRMNERFDEMGARFEGRFDEMSHRMLVQTRWLVGSLTVLGTVISVLLAIAQFTS